MPWLGPSGGRPISPRHCCSRVTATSRPITSAPTRNWAVTGRYCGSGSRRAGLIATLIAAVACPP